MRYLWAISLLIMSSTVLAIDIFGTDYYLRDTWVRVVDDERGTSIVLNTDIFFESSHSDVLEAEQYPALEKVASLVSRRQDTMISVTGHTDNILSQPKRFQISDAQARRVADFLVDYGVDPSLIHEVSGEGDLWPIAPNDSLERRHLNRRVEITFLRELPADMRKKISSREEIEIEVDVTADKTFIEVEIEDPTLSETIDVMIGK